MDITAYIDAHTNFFSPPMHPGRPCNERMVAPSGAGWADSWWADRWRIVGGRRANRTTVADNIEACQKLIHREPYIHSTIVPKARRVYRKAAEVGERFDYPARDALGECCRGVAFVLLVVSFGTVRWEVGD